ncbi:MAG TPA: AraC family transcriptional regulator [Desulfomonilia bacterium]|nr:AraC family transcriptional regulator [Desulfomonilia bacterium]
MSTDLIRAPTAQWLIRQLGEMGIEASRLLKGIRLENGWLDNEDSFIAYRDYIRLITNAIDTTGHSDLGLKLGQTVNIAMFGAFGYALMSSKTLGEAAEIFIKYQDLPGQLTRISMKRGNSARVIQFEPLFPFEDRVLVYALEEVLSTTYYGMNFLVNQKIHLTEIRLTYPAPQHARLYKEIFHCPVRFMASDNSMGVDSSFFSLPVFTANRSVYEYCTKFCDEMLEGLKKSDQFVDRIRNIIMTSVSRFVKIGEMAKELGMSTRSLTRRLQERNTSYKNILNEVRADLARKYLENTNLSIDQIADLVGFSETTTFRKAFKIWSGISPSKHRRINST